MDASAFFLDRLSPATLKLASEAAARGAWVVFEPSAGGNKKYMAAALDIAHVVKYARDRLPFGVAAMERRTATVLEIRTLGDRGLAYRHRLGKGGGSSWIHVGAIRSPSRPGGTHKLLPAEPLPTNQAATHGSPRVQETSNIPVARIDVTQPATWLC